MFNVIGFSFGCFPTKQFWHTHKKIYIISLSTVRSNCGFITLLLFVCLIFFSRWSKLKLWNADLQFVRNLYDHKNGDEHFPVLCLSVSDHKQLYSSARDGTLRFFRRPWSHDNNDILLQTVMDDITAMTLSRNTNTLYSGDDKGIVTKWYHNQVGCQYNVLEEVKSMAVEGMARHFHSKTYSLSILPHRIKFSGLTVNFDRFRRPHIVYGARDRYSNYGY